MPTPIELLSQAPPTLHSLVENYWHDWLLACEESELNDKNNIPLEQLGKVWACSDFVARNCIRYPQMFFNLLEEGFESLRNFEQYKQLVAQAIADTNDDLQLMKALRELRQQEMVRIAWRDINSLASDEIILHELSDFAEAVVATTLRFLEKKQAGINGVPVDSEGNEQALLTFAMGKMGGRELNFSSDIDLIFSFAEDGETSGPRKTSNGEFYLSVIRKLIKVLNEVTADGFVYRVDVRLRPFGESGPLAMSFSGLEHYYQMQGRDWERYAMIKARLITGREADKKYLQSMLTPFIYRRYLDFAMLESIREMKAMINAQVKRKRMKANIKLGAGGIREIEFIGQTLQLIRAGREPELRERSIIKVLALLAEKKYLLPAEVEALTSAYWYLRKLENRLQMLRDMQTHVLPEDELSQQRICVAMQVDGWAVLLDELAQHQKNVDVIFQQLVSPVNETTEKHTSDKVSPLLLFWKGDEVSDELTSQLESMGYTDVNILLEAFMSLRSSAPFKQLSDDNSNRMASLMASLVEQAVSYEQPHQLLERVFRLVKAIAGRKIYISLLNEYTAVQQQMLKLCAVSEWFSKRLVRHPILLDSLLNADDVLASEYDYQHLLSIELKQIAGEDEQIVDDRLEEQMDRMRQFKRRTEFSVAVLDVFYDEPVEKVSDRLTDLANAVLEEILRLSWQAMVHKYGKPRCLIDNAVFYPAMSIVAYGKMGGNELGYGSDLDIIFLHNSAGEEQYTDGEKSIDNQHFFARVAQRVIHFLNTRTYSGMLYEADTRLRPNGQSGLMVSSIGAFETYQHEKAWTWEHQALIRARFVTDNLQGSALIEQEFDRIRSSVLRRTVDAKQLLQDVVEMREKMRSHLTGKSVDFDIKQDAGGLVDIEFMTQAGVLIHAENCADCIKHTATLELINELATVGWYEAEEAVDITEAYRYFRKLKNWQNLQCEADIGDVEEHRNKVMSVWRRLMPAIEVQIEKD